MAQDADTHDRLSKVAATDGLCQDRADVNDLNLGALGDVLGLGDGVGDDELLEATLSDDLECGARKDTVGDKGVDLGGTGLEEVAGGKAKGATSVCHVVDEEGNLARDRTDEDHARDLVGAFPLLVEQGKVDVETVGNRSRALGSTGIGRDNDTVGDVEVAPDVVHD